MSSQAQKKMVATIKNKIMILSLVVVSIFAVAWYASAAKIRSVDQLWMHQQAHVAERQKLLLDIENTFGFGGIIHNFKNYLLRGDNRYYDAVVKGSEALVRHVQSYRQLDDISPEEAQALDAILAVAGRYRQAVDRLRQMNGTGESKTNMDRVVRIDDTPALEGFKTLKARYERLTAQGMEQMSDSIGSAHLAVMAGYGIAFVVVLGSLMWLSASIVSGLDKLRSTIARAERDNDLRPDGHWKGGDEIGEAGAAFDAMRRKFGQIIDQVARMTDHVNGSLSHLAEVAAKSSEGVQHQQSETQQVASAMSEMTASMHEVARYAAEAAEAARAAEKETTEGKAVVTQTLGAINGLAGEVEKASGVIQQLAAESESIGTVLDVIKDIAEQTNLLALNAAIEAARAGEQGRGFAVVADEVRTLAQRTQESTNEIQQTIEKLQARAQSAVAVMNEGQGMAESSVGQAAQAGQSLDAISQAVVSINDLTAQIASAVEQQTAVAAEIDRSVASISEVASEVTDSAALTARTAGEIASEAVELQSVVRQFKT